MRALLGALLVSPEAILRRRRQSLSTSENLMRYDVEVSGFPSSHAGHLCLLGLIEDDYPGTTNIEEWPSWDLPVLQWGKQQGAVVGFSHSGWGLALPNRRRWHRALANRGGAGQSGDDLPNYEMPPFDGIGANEYIVGGARRLRFHFGRRYARRLGTEYLVPHTQLRLSMPDQRGDRLSLHLWRSCRPGANLRQTVRRRAARLRGKRAIGMNPASSFADTL